MTATRAGKQPRRRSSRSYASILRANMFDGSERDPAGVRGADDHLRVMEGRVVLGILVANIAIESFQEIAPNGSLIGSPR